MTIHEQTTLAKPRRALLRLAAKYRRRMASDANLARFQAEVSALLKR